MTPFSKRWSLHQTQYGSIGLTDVAGAIQTSYTYEPFGKTTFSGLASGNAQQFTGRENDGPLYFYRSRYLNPTFGRFISEDRLGLGAGPNVYSYVRDDPTDLIDPTGRIPPVVVAIAIACAGGAAFAAADTFVQMLNQRIYGGPMLGQRKLTWGDVAASAAGGCALGGVLGGVGAFLRSMFGGAATALADDLIVVRGGQNTPNAISSGTGVVTDSAGNVYRVSVNTGATVREAAEGIPHNQIGVTTVKEIQAAGGTVTPDPIPGNLGHCLVGGLTADALSSLLTPTISNPCK